MAADALHVKLLPAITVFSVGGISIALFQRRDLTRALQVTGINAGARCVEISLHSIDSGCFNRMKIDHRIVAHDYSFVCFNEADAAHIWGQPIDLLDIGSCLETVLPAPQIQKFKLMRARWLVLRFLYIDAAHPIATVDQVGN